MNRLSAVAVLLAIVLGAAGSALYYRQHRPAPVLSELEIGFAQDMSAHHQQAVMMADMLAADATRDVKALADQIRVTQLTEIGQMAGWLQLAGAPPAASHPMAWMMPGHDDHSMGMPGMASTADLERLQRSAGPANQTLFLELMTRHHQGGITMAAYTFRHCTNDAVRRAASIMIDEQTQEIQVMTTMLAQRRG